MQINYKNKHELENIYFHDSYFNGFTYDYEARTISFCSERYEKITNTNKFEKKGFIITFNNVILCDFQSCHFWGKGNMMNYLALDEPCEKFDGLLETKRSDYQSCEHSYMDTQTSYLPIEFLLNSGDKYLIICESITYEEK